MTGDRTRGGRDSETETEDTADASDASPATSATESETANPGHNRSVAVGSTGRTTRGRSYSTRWGRWLERLLLVFPVVVGAGVVAVLAEAPVPAVRRTVLTALAIAALLIRLGVPVCLFLDARALDRSEVPWEPNRWLYAAAALLVSAPLVALVFLYRRFEHVPPPPVASRWWVAVALAAVLPPLTMVVGLSGTTLPIATLLAVATTVGAGLLPVGIYRDAAYVRRSGLTWQPNPALYLGLAFLSLLVAILQPLLAAGYLLKRYRNYRVGGRRSSRTRS